MKEFIEYVERYLEDNDASTNPDAVPYRDNQVSIASLWDQYCEELAEAMEWR